MKRFAYAGLIIIIFLMVFAGSCDHTQLHGTVIAEKTTLSVGETTKLELEVPNDLNGIYRIMWEVEPKNSGIIQYKEVQASEFKNIEGKTIYPKYDRTAIFKATQAGTVRILVYGFYKQTNPQPITEIIINVEK